MPESKPFNTHLSYVLSEMCRIVGVKYEEFDFGKTDWFLDHTWTDKQQEEFSDWLTLYLKNTKGAKKELAMYPRVLGSKAQLKKFANQFIFAYGWKQHG